MSREEREYIIMNRHGQDILTVRLINGKTKIFVEEEEIMACRAVAISVSSSDLPELAEIESINDVIERIHADANEGLAAEKISPELDFFVNCSNLEAWVLHDYDTRLLDYRLSFPLLSTLVKYKSIEDPQILEVFLEELSRRYNHGSDAVREYLGERYKSYFIAEELPKAERGALYVLQMDWIKKEQRVLLRDLPDIFIGATIRDGHVVKFDVGPTFETIPEELKSLQHLEELRLCQVPATVLPAWLFSLPKLRKLEINYMDFKNIRPPLKSGESRLKELEIVGCPFETLPSDTCTVDSLEIIHIRRDLARAEMLKGLPEEFGQLENLRELTIEGCPLEGLPESFGKLRFLEFLKITRDEGFFAKVEPRIKELPVSFSELKNLRVLDLSHNQFTEFPEPITHLEALEELDLSNNEIKNVPKEIKNLKKLKKLNLLSNKITTIPEEIGELESLEYLNLSGNMIEYLIVSIGNLKNLKELIIKGIKISNLPNSMRKMKSLTRILLGFNPIKELPDWLKELPSLYEIAVNKTLIPPEKIDELRKKFKSIDFYF